MKLLFVTPKPFYPESSGGAQLSSLLLFERLQERGWTIEVISGIDLLSPRLRRHIWANLSHFRLPTYVLSDDDQAYRCWRRPICPLLPVAKGIDRKLWAAWFECRLKAFKPTVVLGEAAATEPFFKQAIGLGYPCVKMIRSLPVVDIPSIVPPELHWIGNSPYSAAIARDVTGRPAHFVLPLINPDMYRAETHTPRLITFINPTAQKGVEIATEIARLLPDEPFLFVKGKWSGFRPGRIERILRPVRVLPNVEIWENQTDMRRVYALTKILLVPSQFIETFGRVIIEAQLNGIPVVASRVGGVAATLGHGGILVEPRNDPTAYVQALRVLLDDRGRYEHYARLGRENADPARV